MSRLLTRRGPSRGSLGDEQLTIAWQCASLLLGYPDEALVDSLDLVARGSAGLPESVGEPLRRAAAYVSSVPLEALQEEYVATFDTRRRHNLFLTYFAHGDTRKRGVALLRFKQTYLRSGFVLDDTELPDHLCVVLEYAATVDRTLGRRLLLDHRAGLELLRMSLEEAGSGWAGAVAAVCATLPPLDGDEWEAVRRLAAEGPPEEEVGLDPYGGPAFDPGVGGFEAGAGRPPRPEPLPDPTFPRADLGAR